MTQVHPALKVPKLSEAEIQKQSAIFECARRVLELRAQVRQREAREARSLVMLRDRLDAAVAEYSKLTGEAVASAVALMQEIDAAVAS